MDKKNITIVGSYNVGLFFKGQVMPGTGETVICDTFTEGGGGKGSNQAIACSKLGGSTRLIARIGSDKYGKDALAMYEGFGISSEGIMIDDTIHTGMSVIIIDKTGNNMICVVPGANYNLSREDIDRNTGLFRESFIVGFQLENNFDIVQYGIMKAHEAGAMTLLDPAPARKLPEELLQYICIMKPNEHEASLITGITVTDYNSAEAAGRWFIERGVNTAIITLGEKGCVLVKDGMSARFTAPVVKAVDTTGAGDCFSGALMAALANGAQCDEAIMFANKAASYTVQYTGVVEALPSVDDLNKCEMRV